MLRKWLSALAPSQAELPSRSTMRVFQGVFGSVATRARLQPSFLTRHSALHRKALFRSYASQRGFSTTQSSQRYYNNRGSYQRFQHAGNLFQRWAARPTFYYEVGGIGVAVGGFYVYNLEEVPISGRRRFRIISEETEEAMAKEQYSEIIQTYKGRILPEWDRRSQMVQRVLNRLIPASGLQDQKWEVRVIDDPQVNAFVIPGGKVFVFSGILPICKGEDGLAAVLGHEIAHNIAHHAAERMSSGGILIALSWIADIFLPGAGWFSRIILDLGFSRPNSRTQETEADYIGLMMMAQCCYNPEAAVGLWARMEQAEQVQIPQFMSTHPTSYNRREKIMEWLPEAQAKRAESDCGSTLDYAHDFKRAFRHPVW